MVKSISKIFLSFLSIAIIPLVIGCDLNVDLLGLFGSNDLNERLLEKNTFNYLTPEERNFKITVRDPSDPALYLPNPDSSDASAMDPGDPYKYTFIIMTDTHVENGDISDLRKIEAEIKGDVKFLANLGDISQYGAEQDIKAVMDFYRTLSVPCYPVIGNHDIYSHDGSCNWPVWKTNIGSTRYRINGEVASYRVNGTVDVEANREVVNTEYFTLFILDSANAFIGKNQVDWLEDELRTAKGKVFVLTHSDFFVQDKIKIQQLYDQAERARIMSLLRDKCSIAFSGHSHERVIKEFGGVTYISTEDYKSTLTYCLVKVTKTGVSYEFKNL